MSKTSKRPQHKPMVRTTSRDRATLELVEPFELGMTLVHDYQGVVVLRLDQEHVQLRIIVHSDTIFPL